MSQKYFPIKTETACQLKWNWSSIQLYTGQTNSCHRVGLDSIPIDNFGDFHNTPKKLKDRQLMLSGQWPSGGCEYCRDMELVGGQSDRQFHLQIPNLYPPELEFNASETIVTPKILEVSFDNVCNMSCIYCFDKFSSKIKQENTLHGPFNLNGVEIRNRWDRTPNYYKFQEDFWTWMESNYQTLARFHILGGEPFFQKQFERCIEFFESHKNSDVEINIISNLKVSPDKLKKFISKFKQLLAKKQIGRLDITASIDCWGKEQEYIRYGLDMDLWRKNFDYLAEQKWLTLNINQTITSLSMKSMYHLIDYINELRQTRKIGHYHMNVDKYPFLKPEIFGSTFFDNDFKEILDRMPVDDWQYKNSFNMMKTIQMQCNAAQRDPDKLLQLKTFLDEMDRRRGLNWRETFPWLEPELNNVV